MGSANMIWGRRWQLILWLVLARVPLVIRVLRVVVMHMNRGRVAMLFVV